MFHPRAMSLLAAAACSWANAQPVVPAGSGSYYNGVPSGFAVPVDSSGNPVSPRVVPGFSETPQTNEWWSSIIYPRHPGATFGENMHPHPLSARAASDGMTIGYAPTPTLRSTGYGYQFFDSRAALGLGVVGLSAADCRVVSSSDWTVTARLADATRSIDITLGHGLPIAYATVTGGNARVAFRPAAGAATVFANRGNIIGITIGGSNYALCAAAGATWSVSGSGATSTLAGKNYYSVALLPDASNASLDLAAAHAFVFVTGGTVAWQYNSADSTMDATFSFATDVKEGPENRPLVALYRHQWLNSNQPIVGGTFATARGLMKQAQASSFIVRFPFRGILPELPAAPGVDQNQVYQRVQQAYLATNLNSAGDTYFSGKSYGRVAQLLTLADQVGHGPAKQRFLKFLKDELADWLTVGVPTEGSNNAFLPVQAEGFTESSGVVVGPSDNGLAVIDFGGTDYFKLENISFAAGVPNRLTVRFASGSSGSGLFQVRVGALDGPVLAGGGMGGTGGINNWVEGYFGMNSAGIAALNSNNRVHDLYVTCSSPYAGELARIDWIRFDQPGLISGNDRCFYYRANWATLLGNPGSFGLASEMNDHHFHYGYFIMAAAIVARHDPAWAAAYGPMVELLIRDAANWERSDTRFPFLRNFDPYAGHSWAAGHAAFAAGNNQESSSESMNFAAGVALWGSVTGNAVLRDLGMYLFASEKAAIQQYWFDADGQVFPPGVTRRLAGLIWSDGMDYATWFTGDPAMIHGINFLPITPASLYLGHRSQAMLDNWNLLLSQTGGNPTAWQSINWSALATANPQGALALLQSNPNYQIEEGDSAARTYHWIHSLAQYGPIDASVAADAAHYAVFNKAGVRTYIAWNPGTETLGVRFSDGFVLCVPPGETATGITGDPAGSCLCPADLNADQMVDDADFVIFAAAYNLLLCSDPEMPTGCPSDFNADDQVDDADFVIFSDAYSALLCP